MNILIADTATAGYHELVLSRNIMNSSGKNTWYDYFKVFFVNPSNYCDNPPVIVTTHQLLWQPTVFRVKLCNFHDIDVQKKELFVRLYPEQPHLSYWWIVQNIHISPIDELATKGLIYHIQNIDISPIDELFRTSTSLLLMNCSEHPHLSYWWIGHQGLNLSYSGHSKKVSGHFHDMVDLILTCMYVWLRLLIPCLCNELRG